MEYRYPLELLPTPFFVGVNPGPVYDHSSVYIYRILPLPITIALTFIVAPGVSYVEVYDADDSRFLLGEKTEIDADSTFTIDWDGVGVFEPRVWMGSNLVGIIVSFALPKEETIPELKPKFNKAPLVTAAGAAILLLSLMK